MKEASEAAFGCLGTLTGSVGGARTLAPGAKLRFSVRANGAYLICTASSSGAALLCRIDLVTCFGLNRNAPTYIFGVGYSFRVDGLF